MPCRSLFVLLAAISSSAPALAQSAPPYLRNKSIVVSWTENRSFRKASEQAFHDQTLPRSMSVFISSVGRPFTRMATSSRQAGNVDYVGASGASNSGGVRVTSFGAQSMSLTSSMTGGARQITVQFAEGYSSCTANVVMAKQTGSDVIRSKSYATGEQLEIRSVTASNAGCLVRDGNVFAN
jgi:hypothetical protein